MNAADGYRRARSGTQMSLFLSNQSSRVPQLLVVLLGGGREGGRMDSECLLPFGVGCARLLLVRPDPTRPDPVPMILVVRPTGDWS
jgi:hypothetical protein